MLLFSRWRNFVSHHKACDGEEGLQGVRRGHQGQDPTLSLQWREGENGSNCSTQLAQKSRQIKIEAG